MHYFIKYFCSDFCESATQIGEIILGELNDLWKEDWKNNSFSTWQITPYNNFFKIRIFSKAIRNSCAISNGPKGQGIGVTI